MLYEITELASVLDWYQAKLNQIKGLVQPTLMVVALFFVIVAYVAFRSWKKAVIAGIGGAIVIAIVANVSGLKDMIEGELKSAPVPGITWTRVRGV